MYHISITQRISDSHTINLHDSTVEKILFQCEHVHVVFPTTTHWQCYRCDSSVRFVLRIFFSYFDQAKMWLFCLLIALALTLAFVLLKKRFNYWHKHGVPSTSPWTIFGDLSPSFVGGKVVALVYDDIYKAFPDEKFVGVYDLLSPNFIVRDPELTSAIMVKDFGHFQDRLTVKKRTSRLDYHLVTLCGAEWKSVRTKLVPTFSANKLKAMIPMMDHCAQIFDSHLRYLPMTSRLS